MKVPALSDWRLFMTKIHKTKSTLVMSVIIMLLLLLPQTAYAAEGTDGTEMQVLQPQQLEIQLGSNWAGVEFQLKTDAGLYPGTIPVGEDGAGTFSDGKLNTGVNNPRIGWILEQFVRAGAREEILYDAKPHIGTDVLLEVVQNIRKHIIELGGEVRFNMQVTGIRVDGGQLTGLETEDGTVISCSHAVFAIGHSARDTFSMLYDSGVPMEPKPFAMGVRIEHRQSDIDRAQ